MKIKNPFLADRKVVVIKIFVNEPMLPVLLEMSKHIPGNKRKNKGSISHAGKYLLIRGLKEFFNYDFTKINPEIYKLPEIL